MTDIYRHNKVRSIEIMKRIQIPTELAVDSPTVHPTPSGIFPQRVSLKENLTTTLRDDLFPSLEVISWFSTEYIALSHLSHSNSGVVPSNWQQLQLIRTKQKHHKEKNPGPRWRPCQL